MRRLRPWALVLGALLGACACAGAAAPPARSYPHSAVLDGAAAYRLRWGRRGSALAFLLEVRTRGYVGFGLSASGGMASADIVVGGVERGQPYLQVRTGSFPSRPQTTGGCRGTALPAPRSRSASRVLFVRSPSPCCFFIGTPFFPCPSFFCSLLVLHLRTSLPLPFSFLVVPIVLRSSPPRRSYSFWVRALPAFPLNF